MKFLILLTAFIFLTSCKKEIEVPIVPKLPKIAVQNGEFQKENGDVFFPWGFNYTNPEVVGLLEDNWSNEEVWKTIKEDFIEMKELGANVVRIHLQYHEFMINADTPNQLALNRLQDLVEYAEGIELYLVITGLSAYRKSDQPSFYTSLSDEERWNTQKLFWRNIAESVGGNPAVFAYNLMNEPVVSVGCDVNNECEWTPGGGLGGFNFVQNITRTSGLEFVTTLKKWMVDMTQSIRGEDENTLVTVGFLDLGAYNRFSTDLDYLSPHMYPKSGEIQKSIDKLLSNESDVPTVIEEIYNLSCSALELAQFLKDVDGKYDGLMGHYFGKKLEDLDNGNLNEAIQKNFYQFFKDNNPN